MTFCLDTELIPPKMMNQLKMQLYYSWIWRRWKRYKHVDINWKRFLKNTLFLCPNGHEKCEINPVGFQWFDLSKDEEKYILTEINRGRKCN